MRGLLGGETYDERGDESLDGTAAEVEVGVGRGELGELQGERFVGKRPAGEVGVVGGAGGRVVLVACCKVGGGG